MSANLSIREQKKQLRADYLARRRAIDPVVKAQLDAQITAAFTTLVSYRYAQTLLLYYPRTDEVDIRPLIASALADGKKVALPRCKSDNQMDFFFVESESDLASGTFGLMEPKAHCPIFRPDQENHGVLMIIPGLAFDPMGYRLGYGKGYYDRYLEGRKFTTAGLVYSEFIARRLPHGRFDLPVQFIVTEKGVSIVD